MFHFAERPSTKENAQVSTLVLTRILADGQSAVMSPLSPVPLPLGMSFGAGEFAGVPASAFQAPETIETLRGQMEEVEPFSALEIWEHELDGIGIVNIEKLQAHLAKCPDPTCDTAIFLKDQLSAVLGA